MRLSELRSGEAAFVRGISGNSAFRKRIAEMGFITGQEVISVKKAPLRDPVEYNIMGYNVSIRHSEADLIEVDLVAPSPSGKVDVLYKAGKSHDRDESSDHKTLKVALVGNPNSGKTTIFNFASKMRERVGNYSGVTVAAKEAEMRYGDYRIILTDLPGTYSLSSYSPEELYVIDYLFNDKPDVIINVIDSSNLERNLFLTTQLLELDQDMVLALNMWDELEKSGDKLNVSELGAMLGLQAVSVSGKRGDGVNELIKAVIDTYEGIKPSRSRASISFGIYTDRALDSIVESIEATGGYKRLIPPRFAAIKLLEGQEIFADSLESRAEIVEKAKKEHASIRELVGRDSLTIINDARYGFISGALKETYIPGKVDKLGLTRRIDNVLTHHWAGLPLFFGIIWLMFYSTFKLGEYPVSLIERGVSYISVVLAGALPDGAINDLVVNGIIGGVGGVVVFLPNILILFLFISLMEDTGYMARTAFIMDKVMHRAGLHGKSFIPMLMGFGCNVPAVMATRTIESKRDRLVTMMIIPFMSCSARLPVYALFISAFFSSYRAGVLFMLYFFGVILAFITAVAINKTVFKKVESPFIMELPPYRFPTGKAVFRHMWFKSGFFLKKMGGIILISSVVIWLLGYFPRHNDIILTADIPHNNTALLNQNIGSESSLEVLGRESTGRNITESTMDNSYLARIGKSVSVVFAPLGFDWKMTVGIISGLAAKEVVVSTMGVLYHTDEATGGVGMTLEERLRRSDTSELAPWRAMAFMAFILLYFPCIGTLAAIKRESGSTGWMLFTLFFTTGIAWTVSMIIFQIGKMVVG